MLAHARMVVMTVILLDLGGCSPRRPAAPPAVETAAAADADRQRVDGQGEEPPMPVSPALRLTLENHVLGCVNASLAEPRAAGNGGVLVVDAQLVLTSALASCGCASEALAYRALERVGERELPLSSGVVMAPHGGTTARRVPLVLASDPWMSPRGPVTIHIACRPPP